MSATISRLISKIIPYGARVYKESHVPEFLLTAPRLLIAHFFAGLFGGDGCCPSSRYNTKFVLRHTVEFLFSKVETLSENSADYKKEIIALLGKLDIIAYEANPRLMPIKLDGLTKYKYFINISQKSVNKYADTIGFAHCMSKATRLFASHALINLDDNINSQNMNIIKLFDINTAYSQSLAQADILNIRYQVRRKYVINNIKMTLNNGYNKAIKDYQNDNVVIGPVIVKRVIIDSLSGRVKNQRSMSNYEELLIQWNAYHWFRDDEHDKDKDCKRGISGQRLSPAVYATSQHQVAIPCMQMKVLSIKPIGLKPVYSLIVPDTHNFIANGIVIHDNTI